MSWFSKKEKKEEPKIEPPVKVGDKFWYLGVEMLCVATQKHEYGIGWCPCVEAEYYYDGEIYQVVFWWRKFEALKKEIERQGGVH